MPTAESPQIAVHTKQVTERVREGGRGRERDSPSEGDHIIDRIQRAKADKQIKNHKASFHTQNPSDQLARQTERDREREREEIKEQSRSEVAAKKG